MRDEISSSLSADPTSARLLAPEITTSPLSAAFQPFRKYYWPLRKLVDGSARIFYPDAPEQMVTWNYGRHYGHQDSVIEVGSRRGVSTEFLAKNTKMVYTFEPMQANFLATRKRVGNYSNVRLHNFALDNFVGAADLYDNSFIDGSPSLYGTRGYNKSSTVDVRKLDDFKLHDATTLISDCEGAEVGLLKGGLNTLENIKVAIVEVHCVKGRWTRSEVESVLLSKGFFKITFYPGYAKYIGPYLRMCEPFIVAQKSLQRT